ncbi:MAG: hypothetical protein EOP84_11275 [Verrucomicrobiaceae bacterium]|nr:MAG: hypothetical protein EOP84_11275 [Verrucomicrobiaceae bacterium]
MDVSAVVVTSPFASMPSTAIIAHSIDSLALVGLGEAPVIIVMDGCKVGSETRMKKGRITAEGLQRYDQYHINLLTQFAAPRFRVLRSAEHLGFAFAVRLGLQSCSTTYALVAQHDRYFTRPFRHLSRILGAMEWCEHIRYVGFPTQSCAAHDQSLQSVYHLGYLNALKQPVCEGLSLQPLIFWFDSQHVAHVARYLHIFTPFRTLPPALRDAVGLRAVKDMVLRRGDLRVVWTVIIIAVICFFCLIPLFCGR